MHPTFAAAVEALHPAFERLISMPPVKQGLLPKAMPQQGVYLFSEGSRHLYIGRSNKLKARYGLHCLPSAYEKKAAFAFKLAREATGRTKASWTPAKTSPN